tara:strand:+ start:18 stop:1031 length:1014 start_codon:yes stop_codon:yes gene_type:complete
MKDIINSRILFLEEPYNLKFKTFKLDIKNLESQKVLCKTVYTAISPGSETAHYQGLRALIGKNKYPRTLGYCNLAKVMNVGSSVKSYKKNDYILTFEPHKSHFLIDEDEIIAKVPKKINLKEAVCAYLFHLGYNSLHKTKIKYGSRVVVLGLGALGVGAINVFKNAGAEVYAITENTLTKKIAKKIGVEGCYKRSQATNLIKKLGSNLVDVVIITTSSWKDWQLALDLCGLNSIIGVLGFPGRNQKLSTINPLQSKNFYIKQLSIVSLGLSPTKNDDRNFLRFNEKTNIEFILKEIAAKRIVTKNIITGIFPASQIEKAYKNIISHKSDAITYVLKW